MLVAVFPPGPSIDPDDPDAPATDQGGSDFQYDWHRTLYSSRGQKKSRFSCRALPFSLRSSFPFCNTVTRWPAPLTGISTADFTVKPPCPNCMMYLRICENFLRSSLCRIHLTSTTSFSPRGGFTFAPMLFFPPLFFIHLI